MITTIKPGVVFTKDNVEFRVIRPAEKPGLWRVRETGDTPSEVIEMHQNEILPLAQTSVNKGIRFSDGPVVFHVLEPIPGTDLWLVKQSIPSSLNCCRDVEIPRNRILKLMETSAMNSVGYDRDTQIVGNVGLSSPKSTVIPRHSWRRCMIS